MTSYELICLFASIVTFLITLTGWIFTYRSQRKTQQAIANLAEQIQGMKRDKFEDDAPKYLESSILLLSTEEMKDLTLWYSKAKTWFLKGKGTAVDWENKYLREEIALPIRQKLANAKNELDIKNAFDLQKSKPPRNDGI